MENFDQNKKYKNQKLIKKAYFCFFLSGVGALIYEMTWLNKIQLMMGHTVYSLGTTLAAYMSGLGLGSVYFSKLKKLKFIRNKKYSNLSLYLMAELFIGVYALFFSFLLSFIKIPYSFFIQNFNLSIISVSFIQFVFCGLIIFVPTFFMGTTLPLLSEYLYPNKNETSEKINLLYGINTLGALVGCLLAGFLIIPNLGYFKSVLFAAGINFFLYFYMNYCTDSVCLEEVNSTQEISSKKITFSIEEKISLLLLFMSGFSSVVIQTIWNRLASLVFGSSVYIFTIITSIVLVGIVFSSLRPKWFADLFQNKKNIQLLPMMAGLSLLLSNSLLSRASELVLIWSQWIDPGFALRTVFVFMTCFLALIPAAIFLGALFPFAMSNLTQGQEGYRASRSIGIGNAFNILGMIIGAIIGSFLLFPLLGVENFALLIEIFLCSFTIILMIVKNSNKKIIFSMVSILLIAFILVPRFDWELLTSDFFYNRNKKTSVEEIEKKGWSHYLSYFRPTYKLIDRKDDPFGTMSIHESKFSLLFKLNGKPDGIVRTDGKFSDDSLITHLISLYPALVKPKAHSALIIGLGIGETAAQVLKFPEIKKLKSVEISYSMIEFSRKYFKPFIELRGKLWGDERFSIENQDGRNYIENTKENYDIIISEPTNPWVNGVASLFTVEFYQAIAKRLNPGGVASLWFHTYELSCEAVYSVLGALAQAFPFLIVFKEGPNLFILGSRDELYLRPIPSVALELERDFLNIIYFSKDRKMKSFFDKKESVHEIYDFLLKNQLFYDKEKIMEITQGMIVNHDDNQFLQYESGKTFSGNMSCHEFPPADKKGLIEKYWKPE